MVTRALPVAALLAAGCSQFTTVDGAPLPALARPVVIMHRGAGAGNPDLRENTLPAIIWGAGLYDGAEMDVQLSADGTLWLGHDNQFHDCSDPLGGVTGGAVVGCFQEHADADIDAVAYCDTVTATPCADRAAPTCRQHYVRLEEVLQRFSADPTLRAKLLALDVKDQVCRPLALLESARQMADEIHRLTLAQAMDWRLIVETDQVAFMRQFRANGTPSYLFVEGYAGVDPLIATAAREGATGVSYRYTNEPFDPALPAGLRASGLRVMVWPVPDPVDAVGDLAPVWGMGPDIIATDRPDLYAHVTLPRPL